VQGRELKLKLLAADAVSRATWRELLSRGAEGPRLRTFPLALARSVVVEITGV
jgi:hypothetical protein